MKPQEKTDWAGEIGFMCFLLLASASIVVPFWPFLKGFLLPMFILSLAMAIEWAAVGLIVGAIALCILLYKKLTGKT